MDAWPSPMMSATSTSRMRLNLPPKSFSQSVCETSSPSFFCQSLSVACDPAAESSSGPSGPGYTIALWNTLLWLSSSVTTFHSPSSVGIRNSSVAGSGTGGLPGCGAGNFANARTSACVALGSTFATGAAGLAGGADVPAAGLALAGALAAGFAAESRSPESLEPQAALATASRQTSTRLRPRSRQIDAVDAVDAAETAAGAQGPD